MFFLVRELLLLAVLGVKYSGGRTLFVPAHAGFFELHYSGVFNTPSRSRITFATIQMR